MNEIAHKIPDAMMGMTYEFYQTVIAFDQNRLERRCDAIGDEVISRARQYLIDALADSIATEFDDYDPSLAYMAMRIVDAGYRGRLRDDNKSKGRS